MIFKLKLKNLKLKLNKWLEKFQSYTKIRNNSDSTFEDQ